MRELLEQFFRHYLRERNLEDTLALLTDQGDKPWDRRTGSGKK